MDTYLMMLYVSLEQETALKQFFLQNGWQYCRPDLAVVTDNIGPHVEQVPHFVEKFTEADYTPSKPQRVRKANKRKAQEASVEVEPETEQASDGSDTHSDIDNGEAVHSNIEDTECIPEIKVELVSDVADDNEYVDHVNSDPDYEPGDDGLHDIVKEKRKTKGLNTESSVNVQNTDGTVLDDSGSETDIPKPTPAKRKKKGRKSTVSTVADEANTSKTKSESIKKSRKYRSYSRDQLLKAYEAVKTQGIPVHKAAHQFGVPEGTLRDRVKGLVCPNNLKNEETLFTKDEELSMVEHLEVLADHGYVATNNKLKTIGGELAKILGKKVSDKALSNNWVYGYLRRWDSRIRLKQPCSLETLSQAQSITTNFKTIDHYFDNFKSGLMKRDRKTNNSYDTSINLSDMIKEELLSTSHQT